MSNQVAKIEDISIDIAPSIYVTNGLKPFVESVKTEVQDQVPDLTTAKGRSEVASLAAKVSKSKKAVENVGREYLKELKAKPKLIEAELRDFIKEMDVLRDETRKPLTDWEDEQKKIQAEELAKVEAEKLARLKEVDHEIAILLDEKYDREKAEKIEKEKRERKEYEARIAKEATEKAEREKAEALKREEEARQRAIAAEQRAKEQAEEAEAARKAAEEKAKIDAIEAEKKAKERAELEAKRAAEAERQRIEHERLATAELARKKAENKAHRGRINRKALADFMGLGFSEEQGKSIIEAIAQNRIRNISVNY